MDTQIQTSFIPKQSVNTTKNKESRTPSSLISTASFIILFSSIILAVGAYGFKFYYSYSINRPCPNPNQIQTAGCGLIASLEVDKRNLDEDLLKKMQRFDNKIKAGQTILNNHKTLIPLFDTLGSLTLKTVRYSSFGLKDNEVTISGSANSYEDIAIQSKIFETNKNLISPLFSNLDLDTKGDVTFKLTFKVVPELLSYSTYVASLNSNQ